MPIEDEGHAMDEVFERLARRFPRTSRDEVGDAVQAVLAKFDEAVVRNFVPILVVHEAGARLADQDQST